MSIVCGPNDAENSIFFFDRIHLILFYLPSLMNAGMKPLNNPLGPTVTISLKQCMSDL